MQHAGERLHPCCGGMDLWELCFSLYKLTCASYIWDLRTEVLVFLCLIFLESLKERPGPAFSLGVAPSRPSSQATGNQSQSIQTEMPQDYSSSFKKKRKKKPIALLLCHCKHCDVFGGKGKLFCVCVNENFDRQGKLQSNSKL